MTMFTFSNFDYKSKKKYKVNELASLFVKEDLISSSKSLIYN